MFCGYRSPCSPFSGLSSSSLLPSLLLFAVLASCLSPFLSRLLSRARVLFPLLSTMWSVVGICRRDKGLRSFSLKVCQKVEERDVTTYNEVQLHSFMYVFVCHRALGEGGGGRCGGGVAFPTHEENNGGPFVSSCVGIYPDDAQQLLHGAPRRRAPIKNWRPTSHNCVFSLLLGIVFKSASRSANPFSFLERARDLRSALCFFQSQKNRALALWAHADVQIQIGAWMRQCL